MLKNPQAIEPTIVDSAKTWLPTWIKSEVAALLVLLALAVLTWLPRFDGPIDLRWDGGVYYILGTSLAEGKGYKLLNEPGEIDAVQYPPLLPIIIAGHQLILGTDDPTMVGRWLRFSAFIIFILYIYVIFKFFINYLSLHWAFLATILCLFSLHVYFLSDLCFPEILFSLVTVLFVLCVKRESSRSNSISAYLLAVALFALRTIGIAAFAVWILDSLIRKKFKQTVLRAVLVLIPIVCWQLYIASVESSYEYNHPAYAYQRAPYMFYNVSYKQNVGLEDPFAPEKGETSAAQFLLRSFRNAVYIPFNFGESLTALQTFWHSWFEFLLPDVKGKTFTIHLATILILYTIGFFVLGGLILQFFQHQWLISLYVLAFVGAMCLTPFPEQYTRYLMPITPFLVLSLIVFLSFTSEAYERFFPSKWQGFSKYLCAITTSVVLAAELICFIWVYIQYRQQIAYIDKNNRLTEYRLFFYDKRQQDFDFCVTYISQNAKPDDVVATGTPHWAYLRTGLKAVMPPFENDTVKAQQLLDSVPVRYLMIGRDVVKSERYTLPVIEQFSDQWKQVYTAPENGFAVYERVSR